MNLETFQNRFAILCDWYNKMPSPRVTSVYLRYLRDLSDRELDEAVDWAIAECMFMPTPKELLESVRGNQNDELWDRLMRCSVRLSQIRYESNYPRLKEKIVAKANIPPELIVQLDRKGYDLLGLSNQSRTTLEFLRKEIQKQPLAPSTKLLKGE